MKSGFSFQARTQDGTAYLLSPGSQIFPNFGLPIPDKISKAMEEKGYVLIRFPDEPYYWALPPASAAGCTIITSDLLNPINFIKVPLYEKSVIEKMSSDIESLIPRPMYKPILN